MYVTEVRIWLGEAVKMMKHVKVQRCIHKNYIHWMIFFIILVHLSEPRNVHLEQLYKIYHIVTYCKGFPKQRNMRILDKMHSQIILVEVTNLM